jgi:hypothetical protein
LVAGVAAIWLADRWAPASAANQISSVYGFGLVLLAGVAFLLGGIAAWHAIRWKPRRSDDKSPFVSQGDA